MASGSVPDTPLISEGGRRVAFANQGGDGGKVSGRSADTVSVRSSVPSQKYDRRSSVLIFDRLSDMEDVGLGIGEKFNYWLYGKIRVLSRSWFTHCFLIITMILYTIGGAVIFFTIEGQNETKLIEQDIKLQITELIEDLRVKSLSVPRRYSEKEWLGYASMKLELLEVRIRDAFDRHPLVVSHTDGRVWTIWNAVVYCSTLYTTIGYGHLYPTTFTGRVLTMVYSTIGIPLFLIALTDFGKLFTRGIKFLWSYIRRFYYTRSCRRVRRASHVQEIMKGAQVIYEYATFRRGSLWADANPEPKTPSGLSEPQTPAALSSFEIDDEFNLPVSLALTMLVAYMFIGAAVFMVWEKWDFFSAFYFVFISMSTIGFGDLVPEQPIYMVLSIVYLCFGLALMSMCINVVQDKLSDTFKHASVRIGETIGIDVEEEEEEGEANNETKDKAPDGDKEEGKSQKDDEGNDRGNNVKTDEDSPFVWTIA